MIFFFIYNFFFVATGRIGVMGGWISCISNHHDINHHQDLTMSWTMKRLSKIRINTGFDHQPLKSPKSFIILIEP